MTARDDIPSLRLALIAFAVVIIIGGAGLVLAGAHDQRRTAFPGDVPTTRTVATLGPGQTVCQAPIPASSAFSGVELFLPAPTPGARLAATVFDTRTRRALAHGQMTIATGTATPSVRLAPAVSAGTSAELCLTDRSAVPVALSGNTPTSISGGLLVHGKPSGAAFSLVLLQPHPTSLLGALPTMFSRASLFRPTWVGSWTFWLLLALIVAALPIAGAALVTAIRADQRRAERVDSAAP
jgi:hypothetical protein